MQLASPCGGLRLKSREKGGASGMGLEGVDELSDTEEEERRRKKRREKDL